MKRHTGLAKRLVRFFTFEPGEVPPQIDRFFDEEGIGRQEFLALLEEPGMRAAADEARRRYLATLTTGALLKKYDASFVKHLLESELARDGGERQESFLVEIRVLE